VNGGNAGGVSCLAEWAGASPADNLSAGAPGILSQVSEASTAANRVRSGPGIVNEIIAQLNPGTVVKILEGPVCADGLVFWKVESDLIPDGIGWTAEGDGVEYYLEPYRP